jgi:hypothetical protein
MNPELVVCKQEGNVKEIVQNERRKSLKNPFPDTLYPTSPQRLWRESSVNLSLISEISQ